MSDGAPVVAEGGGGEHGNQNNIQSKQSGLGTGGKDADAHRECSAGVYGARGRSEEHEDGRKRKTCCSARRRAWRSMASVAGIRATRRYVRCCTVREGSGARGRGGRRWASRWREETRWRLPGREARLTSSQRKRDSSRRRGEEELQSAEMRASGLERTASTAKAARPGE
jgi:hypothetical protein